jgi:serine/threonine-protein phosphatase 4 catalytic subunit
VDRGFYSVETFLLLLALKVRYPERMTLIRGNHESRQITQVYGFYDECQRKYGGSNVWRWCCEVFDYLALGAIVDGRVFGVHGGLSPNLHSIDQVFYAMSFLTPSSPTPRSAPSTESRRSRTTGPCAIFFGQIQMVRASLSLCFFLSLISFSSAPFTLADIQGWGLSPRGAGYLFGADITKQFAHNNALDLIARAHQLAMEGYKLMFDRTIVTVWSAPNYCYRFGLHHYLTHSLLIAFRCGNVASILELDEHLGQEYKVFSHAPLDVRSVPAKRPPADYFL